MSNYDNNEKSSATPLPGKSLATVKKCGISSAFKSKLKDGLADRSGNVAIIFGLMMVPVITMIGGSVDFGRAMSERTKLHSTRRHSPPAVNTRSVATSRSR